MELIQSEFRMLDIYNYENELSVRPYTYNFYTFFFYKSEEGGDSINRRVLRVKYLAPVTLRPIFLHDTEEKYNSVTNTKDALL